MNLLTIVLLSAPLNMGLITPEDIVNEIKDIDYKDPGLNNFGRFHKTGHWLERVYKIYEFKKL